MRLIYEDRVFASAQPLIVPRQINLPSTARRDLWFRFLGTAGGTAIYAFKTQAEARAISVGYVGTSHLASCVYVADPDPVSLIFDDNAATSPNMTGLVIPGIFNYDAAPSWTGIVYGYASNVAVLIAQQIKAKLALHTAAGMGLEELANRISIGDIAWNNGPPWLAIVPVTWEMGERLARPFYYTQEHAVELHLWTRGFDLTAPEWEKASGYAAAIESILFDEHRTLYGRDNLVKDLQRAKAYEGPWPRREAPNELATRIFVQADSLNVWDDGQERS